MDNGKENAFDKFDEGDRKVALPEGWRVLDIKIFRKIDLFEQQISRLFKQTEKLFDLMKSGQKWMEVQSDLIQGHSRQIDRLDEVYYHVFPERLDQDNKFQRQLNALESKPKPDKEEK